MKHPHCNRSHVSHLFWCRGFAPMFFIVTVALIVVAVGSGLYFTTQKKSPDSVAQPIANESVDSGVAGTGVSTTTIDIVDTVVDSVQLNNKATNTVSSEVIKKEAPVSTAIKLVDNKPVDCGEGAAVEVCMFEHIASCTAAKAIFSDESTGVRVEHTLNGLVNGKCSYRSVIIAAPKQYAILEGLDVRCSLPKERLLQVMQASNEAELLELCTGSYVDVLRQARGMTSSTE